VTPIDIRKLKNVPSNIIVGRAQTPVTLHFGGKDYYFDADIIVNMSWSELTPGNVYLNVVRDWRGAPPQQPRIVIAPESGDYVRQVKISDRPALVHCEFLYDLTGTEWEEECRNLPQDKWLTIPLITSGFERSGIPGAGF
jgi:hypothetical protein